MTRAAPPDSKLAALAASGTVNPHAQDVQDPAFLDNEFFDRRDLVQVRYEMLRRVRTEGQTIADIAARFGVSRPTFYKVQADFDRDGLAGLLPVKRGPTGFHGASSTSRTLRDRTAAVNGFSRKAGSFPGRELRNMASSA